jgi:protein involved in polysaccharide export with SLBB domain
LGKAHHRRLRRRHLRPRGCCADRRGTRRCRRSGTDGCQRAGRLRSEPERSDCVEVFGEDDLRTNGRLNGEGNLSLPLLGSVRLAGLNLTQATARLTELYGRDYLVSPRVNVILVGYAKRRFTSSARSIVRQLRDAGREHRRHDLLEAIAIAGGYTRVAAPGRISVRRTTR